jgi:release factor glutamine methyltransferase
MNPPPGPPDVPGPGDAAGDAAGHATGDATGDRAPGEAGGSADTVTWRQLWDQTAAVVGERAAARWLCEVASGAVDGAEFLDCLAEPATVRMVAHLDAMLSRLQAGEPLQYVLGEWSFRRITLAVDRRVLIPRPETELVAEVALAKAAAVGPTRVVADLGTGSGAIGLALAQELPRTGTTVWLTDRSRDALDVARANLAGIGPAAANVRVAEGSWFDALPDAVRCDVIVANPPYVAVGSPDLDSAVGEWEPHDALFGGDDGLDHLRSIVAGATERLEAGGWLVVEIGADQGATVAALFRDHGFEEVEVAPDLAGHDRIVLGRRAGNSRT